MHSFINPLALVALTLIPSGHSQSYGHNDLVACLLAGQVPVTVPGDPAYAQASNPFNVRLPYSPAAIATPHTPEQVSSAVTCAGSSGVKVQAKGGGHSYSSYSSGGQNGSLVISVENFGQVTVDHSTNVATVGAGQRLGNMALSLHNQSARALPHGSCPGVGIGGHATHGGYGYSSRNWGLALDTIVGLDVVLANGTITHTSTDQNPDLFYAFRGAADSFGVVTNFYMQTQPAPEEINQWSFTFGPDVLGIGTGKSGEDAANMFSHIQDFALNSSVTSKDLGFGLHIDNTGISMLGIYTGPKKTFDEEIKPELVRGLPPHNETVQVVDWVRWLEIFGDGSGPLDTPLGSAYDEHSDFYAKSLLSPEATPITHEAFVTYFDYIIANAGAINGTSSWFSILDLYGGAGSQINAVPSGATSFPHRDRLFSFQHYGQISDYTAPFPANIEPFVEGLNDALPNAMPDAEWDQYINYIDPNLSAAEAHEAYFGADVYGRLLALKQQYDPQLTFWNPQAIGVQ